MATVRSKQGTQQQRETDLLLRSVLVNSDTYLAHSSTTLDLTDSEAVDVALLRRIVDREDPTRRNKHVFRNARVTATFFPGGNSSVSTRSGGDPISIQNGNNRSVSPYLVSNPLYSTP